MEFIVDTRNQKDDFVIKSLNRLGHSCSRLKLYFGDIVKKGDMLKSIDFKSSSGGIMELIKNICSKDHIRFKEEINKCINYGGQLTFLCFEDGINCIDDIRNFKIPVFNSTQYKWCYYSKIFNEKISKAKIKSLFDSELKANKIKIYGDYDYALSKYIRDNYYLKKEVSHIKGDLMTKVKLETFIKALKTMSKQDHYGKGVKINFEFCSRENSGEKIIEIMNKF